MAEKILVISSHAQLKRIDLTSMETKNTEFDLDDI